MTGASKNPFHILGVSPSALFETIQKAFTKLALQHHPDTAPSSSSSSLPPSTEQFIEIRLAYERIRDGTYLLQLSKKVYEERGANHYNAQHQTVSSEEDFLDHLFQQRVTKISSAQRRELIELDSSRIPGATYNGPGWDFA